MYLDACDVGIAAILQQVQLIKIRDLKGTKGYDKLKATFDQNQFPNWLFLPSKVRSYSLLGHGTNILKTPPYQFNE